MDENYENLDLKSRLIIAGLDEINSHGVTDFSLRRVAASCGVSCAAPYRHFKNKDDLILELIIYIGSRWELIQNQIEAIYKDNIPELITELSISLIRFRLANPEFRAVLGMNVQSFDPEQQKQLNLITSKIRSYTSEYFSDTGKENADRKTFMLLSYIYGAGSIMGPESSADSGPALKIVRDCIQDLFS